MSVSPPITDLSPLDHLQSPRMSVSPPTQTQSQMICLRYNSCSERSEAICTRQRISQRTACVTFAAAPVCTRGVFPGGRPTRTREPFQIPKPLGKGCPLTSSSSIVHHRHLRRHHQRHQPQVELVANPTSMLSEMTTPARYGASQRTPKVPMCCIRISKHLLAQKLQTSPQSWYIVTRLQRSPVPSSPWGGSVSQHLPIIGRTMQS